MAIQSTAVSRKTIKAAALPAEHGGWGFISEPIALGLLAAFSWSGLLLSLAAFAVFLIHQPLKMAVKDNRKGLRLDRTIWAERFLVGYGLVATVTFLGVLLTTSDPRFLVPLALATPLAFIQLFYDIRNESRAFLPEACGAVALASVAAAIALLDGMKTGDAYLLWLLLSLRAVPSILYVRARIRAEKGKEDRAVKEAALNTNLAAPGVVIFLTLQEYVPAIILAPYLFLFARSLKGLSPRRRSLRVSTIGFLEMSYGFATVFIVALGYLMQ